MTEPRPIQQRVVKLGGSLLSCDEWSEALIDWLQWQSQLPTALIVGGGESVNDLRSQQLELDLSDEQAHWAAVQIMSQNAFRVSQTLSWPLVYALPSRGTQQPVVLDVATLLKQHADWPTDWGFTSDSIAAKFANHWQCVEKRSTELILLKSRTVDGSDLRAWAESGFVDTWFPRCAESVPVRAINLRSQCVRRQRVSCEPFGR